MKLNKMIAGGGLFILAFSISLVGIMFWGGTGTFHVEIMPDTLTYTEYNNGSIFKQAKIHRGDPIYDALYSFLKSNPNGWSLDLKTYAPSLLFQSDVIAVNCGDDLVIINYKTKYLHRWTQISKRVGGCKAAIMGADKWGRTSTRAQ